MIKIILLFIVLHLGKVYAQKSIYKSSISADVEQGDKYFANGDYFLSEQYYSAASLQFPDDYYIKYQLAESARLYFDYSKAEENYAIVSTNVPYEFPLARFWFAVMLKTNGKYAESKNVFDLFIQHFKVKNSQDKLFLERSLVEYHGCLFSETELKKPVRNFNFTAIDAPLNSTFTDYSPVIYKNDTSIVITSGRENLKNTKTFNQLGEQFSDNYLFEKKEEIWTSSEDKEKFEKLNSEFNDGAGVFSSDKSKFYFTRCNQENDGNDGECALFVSKKVGNEWSSPKRLNENINMKGYWTSHPALSTYDDTLFFVSKRPGGKGEHDIWYSRRFNNEDWGEAKNLVSVNTPFSEIAPTYYSKEKTLFFSSNGYEGLGGLDIFKATGTSYKKIENIGMPFNSNKDDIYFVLGEKFGYLSSNRDGGKGNYDIYSFYSKSSEALIAYIEKDSIEKSAESISINGTISVDDTKLGASDVTIVLENENGITFRKTITNKNGHFRFDNLSTKENIKVLLDQKDDDKRLTVNVEYFVNEIKLKNSKTPPNKALFENIYFDFDAIELRSESKLILKEIANFIKLHPEIQIEISASADSLGNVDYNNILSQKRGTIAIEYLKTLGVENTSIVYAMGEGKPIASNINPIGRQLNRSVSFFIIGGVGYKSKAMAYVVEPSKSLPAIAKEFGMTLFELKKLNGLNGTLKIPAYRAIRVKSAFSSIIAPKTIEQSNELQTSTILKNEDNNTPITEDLFHIVKEKETAYSIAKLYGLTVEKLLLLNNLKNSSIKIAQKLRIKN